MGMARLYILFFCSGISGLIYQVVWIREFGNVFGNTDLDGPLGGGANGLDAQSMGENGVVAGLHNFLAGQF